MEGLPLPTSHKQRLLKRAADKLKVASWEKDSIPLDEDLYSSFRREVSWMLDAPVDCGVICLRRNKETDTIPEKNYTVFVWYP